MSSETPFAFSRWFGTGYLNEIFDLSPAFQHVHVPPSVTSLTIPNQFLEPNTGYELEVLVLEFSGNQTITSLFFETW